jgi:hypothetical protein
MTRSIVIPMKRRRQGQKVEPYRRRVNGPQAQELSERIGQFAEGIRELVSGAWPELPEGIEDRDADIWEPILSIADAAGGHWPQTARDAAIYMVAKAKEKPATLGIKLLADIREVLGTDPRISTNDLLHRLHALEMSPWAHLKGEPIDSRFLANTLGKYDIPTNNTVKIDGKSVKGYQAHHFYDAFERYLTTPVPPQVGNSGNPGNLWADQDGEAA